jgi:uncharacterized protein (DUF2062 family)
MFRDKLRQVLIVQESPHKIAFAFAVGVFIGMSPLLGIHTLLGIAFAWKFRLNKFITLIGVFVTNPWTIVPIYTLGTWVGAQLMGIHDVIPEIEWNHITLLGFMNDFRPLLVAFIAGTTCIGLISALISYLIIYHAVKIRRG